MGVFLHRVLVGDNAYLPTRDGFLHLAAVLDLSSRRCVGWSMRYPLYVDLLLSALHMTREARRPGPRLIFHSERGSQCGSAAHCDAVAGAGMPACTSGKGDCYANAVAESFFAALEFELLRRHDWRTRAEAWRTVFRYIATRYNRK